MRQTSYFSESLRTREWGNILLASADIPSVSVILRTIWSDLNEVWVRLRRQSVTGLSIIAVFGIVGAVPEMLSNRLLSEAISLITKIATLPLEIAIYRLLILDEVEPGYAFAMSTVRFQRMLGWTLGLWAIATIPSYIVESIAWPTIAATLASVAMIVIGFVIFVRLSLLLPAIAVDAPGASAGNAVADTQGHVWMIVKPYLVVIAAFVLVVIAAMTLAWLTGLSGVSGKGSLAASAFISLLGFVTLCACTIVAARLFMSLGARLKGAAIVPA